VYALVALVAAHPWGCATGDGGLALSVDVRTDLVPASEFDAVVTVLEGAGSASIAVAPDGRGSDARRVAEFRGLRPGPRLLSIELRRAGATVLSRRVALRLAESMAVTVVMTRSCVLLSCPGTADPPNATECASGRCVAPTCGAPSEAPCGEPVCSVDTECTSTVACVRQRCIDGACYALPDPGLCAPTEVCDPVRGCVPRTVPPDAGPADAGPVDAGAGDVGPSPIDARAPVPPEILFSSVRDGPPETTFFADQTLYGRIVHTGPTETEGCAEVVGSNDGFCDSPANFTTLPNTDWSYDFGSSVWRATIGPFAHPPNVYRLYARNTTTGLRSAPVLLTLRAARPLLVFSTTRDGPPVAVVPSSATVHGRVLYLRADDAEACVEVVERGDTHCEVPSNFTRMPNDDWSYDSASATWRATFPPGSLPALTYRVYFRRSTTGERSLPVLLTVTP
jgi:hypothetical protein